MNNEAQWVRIERTFDAPLETVWQLWTDPAWFQKWYGPNGMQIPETEMNLVVGGKRKICMESAERGMRMWFIGEFTEIEPPVRLVYTESMCDEAENILTPESMGMPAGHPEVTQVIVELAQQDGKTHMRMTHVGVPADSGGAGGWAQAFDSLERQLSSI